MNDIEEYGEILFEKIKHIDEDGNEYWLARELMVVLQYKKWENFHRVIKQAVIACEASKYNILEHFPDVRKMFNVGNGAIITIIDYKLSRYACYLIAQNADSKKKVVALAQTYFVVQTRRNNARRFTDTRKKFKRTREE